MRKAILLLLAAVSSSAAAEWIAVSSNETFTTYVDPASIRKEANMAKMWDLLDFNKARVHPVGVSYLSGRSQNEYDCKEERTRRLAFSFHSGNMSGVETVYINSDSGNWTPVAPGSINELLWKIACGKR